MTRKTLADQQYDRAARWLRNHPDENRPPRHIAIKIAAQRRHLARAFGDRRVGDIRISVLAR